MENTLAWYYARKGKVTYSMTSRNGPDSYDCSSAMYHALIEAGIFPANMRIGNTDSLFADLEAHGFQELPKDNNGNVNTQRGDVFIWGKRGASSGASGHTGAFVDTANIIHCNYGFNGISVNDHDAIWEYNEEPPYTFYRYQGTPAPSTGINRGDTVLFPDSYVVEQRATVNDIIQVASQRLYNQNFDWTDNGVAVAGISKVDDEGYRLEGITNPGERFVIPGAYTVSDVMADSGVTYALVTVGGYEVWVDIAVLIEISAGQAGKAVPVTRPTAPVEPSEPTPDPIPEETVVEPPVEPETPIEPKDPIIKPEDPKEDIKMAFSNEDIAQLKIATERIQETVNEVSASPEVQEITASISKKTKLIVYIFGDTLIGLGLIVPGLAIVLDIGTLNQITALSGVLATSGAFILTMFGLLKK